MDSLDFAIYRHLSQDGAARFWAGRRVIDPRITPREIAERVGISESGVRARLHHLTDRGFLKDRAVTPNPSLFGTRVFVADLLVMQSSEVDRILGDLALVEDVIFTRDVMDEDERKMQVYFVSEGDSSAFRLAALLGRLTSESAPVTARSYYLPPCDCEPSPLDWRVLQTVCRRPDASFAEIAKAVGISPKTAARSYHQLIESHACWWTHGPNSEEFPLSLVSVDLRRPEDLERITGWISSTTHDWMPVASDGFGVSPDNAVSILAGLVPADLPTALERFVRKLAAVEGVVRVRRTFALGSASYAAWFADRISDQVRVRP